MKTPRFIKMRKRSEPDLPDRAPIWLGNNSNGEYFHVQTPYEKKLHRMILQKADENARKAKELLFMIQNSRKARMGGLAGLLDPVLMARKQTAEKTLKEAVEHNSELRSAANVIDIA